MKVRLLREMLRSLVPEPLKSFYAEVMLRKEDDHHASHNDFGNQMLHLVSSSVFLYCYAILAFDLTEAVCLGLAALFVRQFGHAVLEPDAHEKEMSLLGYTTRNKTLIVVGYMLIPVATWFRPAASAWSSAEPARHRAVLVVLDAVRDRRAHRVSHLEVQLPHVDGLVHQACHRPTDRHHHLFSAPTACLIAFVCLAAALLSVERIAYVLIWRNPAGFRQWSTRGIVTTFGGPVELLVMLFGAFKLVQIAVFLAWHLVFGDGTLWPQSRDPKVIVAGALLIGLDKRSIGASSNDWASRSVLRKQVRAPHRLALRVSVHLVRASAVRRDCSRHLGLLPDALSLARLDRLRYSRASTTPPARVSSAILRDAARLAYRDRLCLTRDVPPPSQCRPAPGSRRLRGSRDRRGKRLHRAFPGSRERVLAGRLREPGPL